MKRISYLLTLFLLCTAFAAQAQGSKNLNDLAPGDWLFVELAEYYPYVAPGIEQETPWRVENIRRNVMKATVIEKTATTISFDYRMERIYDCRNYAESRRVQYYDSRYAKDDSYYEPQQWTGWYVAGQTPSKDKVLAKASYDIKTGKLLEFEKSLDDLYFSYTCSYVMMGLHNNKKTDLGRSRGVVDGSHIPQEGMSLLLGGWSKNRPITFSAKQEAAPENKKQVFTYYLSGLPEDVTHNQLSREYRVIGASFALPTNVTIVYTESSPEGGWQRKTTRFYTPYPCEYTVEGDKNRYIENSWLVSPGDSIVRTTLNDGRVQFTGKGSGQNNLITQLKTVYRHTSGPNARAKYTQVAFDKYFPQIDIFWQRSFQLNELYRLAQRAFYDHFRCSAGGKPCAPLDWNAFYFTDLSPLIDNQYFPYHYKSVMETFISEQKKEGFSNLFNRYPFEMDKRNMYYENKIMLSGYLRYLFNADVLFDLMSEDMLAECSAEYDDFVAHCPDVKLLHKIVRQHQLLEKLEKGSNIRNTDIELAKKLLPWSGSSHKYIIVYMVSDNIGALPLYFPEKIKKELAQRGLEEVVDVHFFYPEKPQLYYEGDGKLAMDSLYTYVSSRDIEPVFKQYNYREELALLMREDGTILYRQFDTVDFYKEKNIANLIEQDLSRPISDFWKGFRKGLFITLAIGILIILIVRVRIDAKRAAEKRKQQIKELELKAIRSQMNPHFIFNAMGSIQNLIGKGAGDEANEYLIRFSRLLRMVLNNSEKKLVPLSGEIEQLSLYLNLEQLRVPFTFNIVVDENIETDLVEIPGMLIQPFAENAVKHAIVPHGGGEINIKINQIADTLTIEITDDGPGIAENETEGFGVKAITEELQILSDLYGKEISLKIENLKDAEQITGCRVLLSIPVG